MGDSFIGETLIGYTILREIGEGGMGKVYLAENQTFGQQVAIKILDPVLARNPELRERFAQEARIQIALQHNNIVRVMNAQCSEELSFLVMEYIDGQSLDQVLKRRGKLSVEESVKIFPQVLDAVGYAHDKGVIHRDLKPSNILVCADGTSKVTDFGIAKVLGDTQLTRTGTSMGSPHYMSPEQVLGKKDIDHRTDIYSLGATLYEMLTGRPPFVIENGGTSDSDFLVKKAHVRIHPKDASTFNPEINDQLDALLQKCLSKEVDKRIQSCHEFSMKLSQSKLGESRTLQDKKQNKDELKMSHKATESAKGFSSRLTSFVFYMLIFLVVRFGTPKIMNAFGKDSEEKYISEICFGAKYNDLCRVLTKKTLNVCKNENTEEQRAICSMEFMSKQKNVPTDVSRVAATFDEKIGVRWFLGKNSTNGIYHCEGLNARSWSEVSKYEKPLKNEQSFIVFSSTAQPVFTSKRECQLYLEEMNKNPFSFVVVDRNGKNVCVKAAAFHFQRQVQLVLLPNSKVITDDGETLLLKDGDDYYFITTSLDRCAAALNEPESSESGASHNSEPKKTMTTADQHEDNEGLHILDSDGLEPNHEMSLSFDGLVATLQYLLPDKDAPPGGMYNRFLVTVFKADQQVVKFESDYFFKNSATLQMAELDTNNDELEVIFSAYTGGASCCMRRIIFSQGIESKNWLQVDSEYDGEFKPARDYARNGRFLFKEYDNSFRYKFAAGASSYGPVQFFGLEGTNIVDVTRISGLRSQLLYELEKMKKMKPAGRNNSNGYWAAYVALNALLGRFDSSWNEMLLGYDQKSTHGLKECLQWDDQHNCIKERVYGNYPEALHEFLLRQKYIFK